MNDCFDCLRRRGNYCHYYLASCELAKRTCTYEDGIPSHEERIEIEKEYPLSFGSDEKELKDLKHKCSQCRSEKGLYRDRNMERMSPKVWKCFHCGTITISLTD